MSEHEISNSQSGTMCGVCGRLGAEWADARNEAGQEIPMCPYGLGCTEYDDDGWMRAPKVRYTLFLTQPDGSYSTHTHGDGPEIGPDTDTPALPDALLTALGELYGDRWRLSAMWASGWRVLVDRPGVLPLCAGYIDIGPTPAEPDPRQAVLAGAP